MGLTTGGGAQYSPRGRLSDDLPLRTARSSAPARSWAPGNDATRQLPSAPQPAVDLSGRRKYSFSAGADDDLESSIDYADLLLRRIVVRREDFPEFLGCGLQPAL